MQSTVFFAAGYLGPTLLLPASPWSAVGAGVAGAVLVELIDVLALQRPHCLEESHVYAALWAAAVAVWGALLGLCLVQRHLPPQTKGQSSPQAAFVVRLLVYSVALLAAVGSMLAAPLDVLATALLAFALDVGSWPLPDEPRSRLLALRGLGRLFRTAALLSPVVFLSALALQYALWEPQLLGTAVLVLAAPLLAAPIAYLYPVYGASTGGARLRSE